MSVKGNLAWKTGVKLFFLITIMTLVASACVLPSVRMPELLQATSAPAENTPTVDAALPTAPATVTGPALLAATPDATQPPALVEVQPQPGSVLLPNDSLTFYFSQPMDAEAVQRGLEISPPVQPRFDWLDASTLRLTPDQPLPASSNLLLKFNNNVRSLAGIFLNPVVELVYRTADPLRLMEQLPRPESETANPAAAVVAVFSQPVVPLVGEEANRPVGFNLEPQAAGRGEWLNTTTYIFYPEPALQGDTRYTVRINRELTGLADADWSFKTARPEVFQVSPENELPVNLDSAITLTFNQPVDRNGVEQGLQVTTPEGEVVAGLFSWNEDGTQVTFTPTDLLARDTRYRITLPAESVGQGNSGLAEDYLSAFLTVPDLAVVSSEPGEGEPLQIFETSYGVLTLHFSAPLAQQDFADLVQITPEISDEWFTLDESGTTLSIGGYFEPATGYTLTLAETLKDRWGKTLGEPYPFDFHTTSAASSFTIPMLQAGSNILFLLPSDATLPARATNIQTIRVGASRLDLESFINLARNEYDAQWPPAEDTWQENVVLPEDSMQPVEVPLTRNGSNLEPGLYAFHISSPQTEGQPVYQLSPFLAVVSTTNLHLKRSQSEVFVWAVDAPSQQPLNGLEITLYDNTGSVVGTAVTENGVATFALSNDLDQFASLFAVTGQQGAPDFSLATTSWTQSTQAWDFGLRFAYNSNSPVAYLYTDRPIYQPGQSVSFRAIARQADNGRYRLLDQSELTFQVFAPFSGAEPNVIYSQTVPLSSFGNAEGTFTLPVDAQPGYYNLVVDGINTASIMFQVASYRKPTMDVQVSLAQAEILAGMPVNASVNARYYFGAPAADVPVTWTLTASPSYFYIPEGYQNGKMDQSWLDPLNSGQSPFGQFIAQGQGVTSAEGQLQIMVDPEQLDEALDLENEYRLTLEVTAQDESQQPVSGRAELELFPAEIAIGVRPDGWSGQAGVEYGFDVQIVDRQAQPAGSSPLSAVFQKVTWKRPDNQSATLQPLKAEYLLVASTDFQTDSNGRARLAFIPPEPGTYMLDVKGEGATTQVLVWVSGAGSAPWPSLPNQHMRLTADAESYEPGQSAKIFIPNPFDNSAKALVTVERGKVMRWQVLDVEGASTTLELPLDQNDAPNVFVSVLLLGNSAERRPDFRVGYVELKVNPAERLLNVELIGQPQRAAPGEDVQFALQVKDAQGNPVQGSFSLAVVDKAALALAEPNSQEINTFFYGPRGLGVITSTPLAAYGWRIPLVIPGRGGGGGGSGQGNDVRNRFADTAYWNGAITTDANGFAEVSATLPDNLTTWTVDVRGVDSDTRTGQATLEVTTSKPLMIQPVTPRFFVRGDHAQLSALVINNSGQELAVEASLQPAGFTLDESAQAAQRVTVAAGGRQAVTWWGTVDNVEKVSLLFNASGGGLSDSATPEAGDIPVLTYSDSATFGTAGMLDQAGVRQEQIALPKTFTPTGGGLELELSPSLAAALVSGLQVVESYPDQDMPVTLASRLLPNLEAYRTLTGLGADNPALKASLDAAVREGVNGLVRTQNSDGGWGWVALRNSDPYLSAYILLALSRAKDAGAQVPAATIALAQTYLLTNYGSGEIGEGWQKDRTIFIAWVIQESGAGDQLSTQELIAWRPELSPWAKALLALILQQSDNANAALLLQDVNDATVRTATGAHWEDVTGGQRNHASTVFTTAVVTYALARVDPAAPVLVDAVRYLASARSSRGGWYTPYDTAWVLMALSQALKGTADIQGNYAFSASVNGAALASGQAEGSNAFNPVTARVPLSDLRGQTLNTLQIQRDEGIGRLYYRAYLHVDRPVESTQPVNQGIIISRSYTVMDATGCAEEGCPSTNTVTMSNPSPVVLVRLSFTLANDVSHLLVEDTIPAGAEILNTNLQTSQQALANEEPSQEGNYNPLRPFAEGWGWWYFSYPQVYDTRIRWTAENVPAGTYQLVYRLVLFSPGEYRVIPARAYNYYFPEVQGTSAGSIFTIQP